MLALSIVTCACSAAESQLIVPAHDSLPWPVDAAPVARENRPVM